MTLQNYLREWKRRTQIESKRYKMARVKAVFRKLQNSMFNAKLVGFYQWLYVTKNVQSKASSSDVEAMYQQGLNAHILQTQAVVNSQLRLNYERQNAKVEQARRHNLIVKVFREYFHPLYSSSQDKYFQKWKNQVIGQQKFELKCLDKTNEILADELEQSMQVNENLSDETQINTLLNFNCPDCIRTKLLKGTSGLFGDDSDEEDVHRAVGGKDYNEHTDPRSDPLSDSINDKNKLSKSEKSLQLPLQLFQQEQKASQQVMTGQTNKSSFIRTTQMTDNRNAPAAHEGIEDSINNNSSSQVRNVTDGTRTTSYHMAQVSHANQKHEEDNHSENVNDSGDDRSHERDASNVLSSDDDGNQSSLVEMHKVQNMNTSLYEQQPHGLGQLG